MGERGPIPKRNAERLTKDGKRKAAVTSAPSATSEPVRAPAPRGHWEELTKKWYQSIVASGMAQFYEPSDWMMAVAGAEALDRELKPKYMSTNQATGEVVIMEGPVNSGTFNGLMKLSGLLGLTEGDRRRMQVELTRANQQVENEEKTLRLVHDAERDAFGA